MSMYSLHLIGWEVRPQLTHGVVSQNCIPGGDEELFFFFYCVLCFLPNFGQRFNFDVS